MKFHGAMSALATLALGSLLALGAGCATQPQRTTAPRPEARQPDVRKHMVGVWWRAHRARVEGIQLAGDGRLGLSAVPYLRGLTWRIEGRKLHLQMRDDDTGLVYDDELYIRRLTDRTLIVEADDSYFAGTYQRSRDTVAAHVAPAGEPAATGTIGPPPVDAHAPAPAILDVAAAGTAIDPLVLHSVAAEAVPPRGGWLTVLADLAACGQQLNRSLCPRFYVDERARMLAIEICQPDRTLAEGMHFIDAHGARTSVPWFDPGFGRFLCDNGCGTGCRYEISATAADGRPTEAVYRFEMGATWGWVRLQLGADGTVRVLDRNLRSAE